METEKIDKVETENAQVETALLHETSSDQGAESTEIVVRAPRKMFWELALMVFTLSFYLPFWAVGRARDIKSATGNSYRPWLWFFAPWFWIPGVIAYNSMFKELQIIEAKQQRDKWAFWAGPWFLVFMLSSIFFNIQNRVQVPFLTYLLTLLVFCLLFGLLHRRFNQWKIQDSRLTFKGKRSGYTWYEWCVLAFAVPFFLFIVYEYVWKTIRTFNVPKYNDQQEVVVEKLGFSFVVHGDQWRPVDSKEADFEMIGPGDDSTAYVYNYANDQTVDEITALRFEIVEESYENLKCSETKRFEKGRKGVRSMMSCSGRFWGSDIRLTSLVSELDGTLIEFVGITTNSSRSFTKEISKQINAMAESFHIVSEGNNE